MTVLAGVGVAGPNATMQLGIKGNPSFCSTFFSILLRRPANYAPPPAVPWVSLATGDSALLVFGAMVLASWFSAHF